MNRDLSEDNTDRYVEFIEKNILQKIDYDLLQQSYDTKEKAYAKSVLNSLSQAAVQHYGTAYFDGFDENEYVLLPSIIRSDITGNICIALLEIDLLSSGEHCNTIFLVKYGCIPQLSYEIPKKIKSFIRNTYGSYEYMYTLGIEIDHHVDIDTTHENILEILNTFEQYPCDFDSQNNELER
ncbi:MAG: hypothetical protein R3Y09_03895 [Clostridia bacterium]